MGRKCRRWTLEEDDLIREKYVEMGDDLVNIMDRTVTAIRERASRIGVANRHVGGKREHVDDVFIRTKKITLEELDDDATLEDFKKHNLELIKSLSFRNREQGKSCKLYY